MYLISCGNCGSVIDINRISKPNIIAEDDTIDMNVAVWHNKEFCPVFKCPVCSCKILYKTGDKPS